MDASTPGVGSQVFVHWKDGRRLEAVVQEVRTSSRHKRGSSVVFKIVVTDTGAVLKTRLVHLNWGYLTAAKKNNSPPPPPPPLQPPVQPPRARPPNPGTGQAEKKRKLEAEWWNSEWKDGAGEAAEWKEGASEAAGWCNEDAAWKGRAAPASGGKNSIIVGTAPASGYRSLCRDASGGELFCSLATACCFAAGCVCCAYKLVVEPAAAACAASKPHASPHAGSGPKAAAAKAAAAKAALRFRPNQRPEQCLREAAFGGGRGDGGWGGGGGTATMAASLAPTGEDAWKSAVGGLYGPLAGTGACVLTVGDGDLSFSVALAESCPGLRLVATTHLTLPELEAAYGVEAVGLALGRLKASGAQVAHGVDATALHRPRQARALRAALAACFCPGRDRVGWSRKGAGGDGASSGAAGAGLDCFDRVVWNFPCVAGPRTKDADAQLAELGANQALLRAFFASLVSPTREGGGEEGGEEGGEGGPSGAPVLAPRGEVHVAHKAKPPFGHWGIESCARAGGGGALASLGACVFDRSGFPGYEARKVATGCGSFPTWDAKVYMWAHKPTPAAAAGEGGGGDDGGGGDERGVPPTLGGGGNRNDLRAHPLTMAICGAAAARDDARRRKLAAAGDARAGSGGKNGGEGHEEAARLPLSLARAGPGLLRMDEPFLDAVATTLRL